MLVLIAALLRLHRLDAQAVWLDEVASCLNAQAFGRGGLVALAGADHVAPLHSILLWYAAQIGGANAVALRMPSVVAGVLAVPLAYVVARRMLGEGRVALITAGLVAVSPFAIWYAQEARMYALLLLCALAHVALSWPAAVRPLRMGELIALTIVSVAGFYTHHYMVLVAASFGLFLLLADGVRGIVPMLRRRRFWAWAATQILAFLIFAYWLYLTADKLHNNAGSAKPAVLLWTPYTFFTFIVGTTFGPAASDLRGGVGAVVRSDGPAVAIAALASFVVIVAGLREMLRPARRTAALWLLIWLLLPVALAILATFVTNIQFNVRYVILCYPALAIILALAIDAASRPRVQPPNARAIVGIAILVMLGCMAVSLANWYGNARYAKEEVRPLAALLAHRPAGTLVVADNARVTLPLGFYGANLPADVLAVDNIRWARTPAVVAATLNRDAARGPPRRIWLIQYRSWEADPTGRVAKWVNGHAAFVGQRRWPGVSIRQYVTR